MILGQPDYPIQEGVEEENKNLIYVEKESNNLVSRTESGTHLLKPSEF